MNEVLGRRPILIAIAGPNGAGKSTFYDSHLVDLGFRFVNADVLSLATGIDAYEAAAVADKIRRSLVAEKASFLFETVFSDPAGEKLKFLKNAGLAGYTTMLIFIGVNDSAKSDERVAMRVSQGGHDVPTDKLMERYPRILRNLKRALAELPNVMVYDNSELTRKYRLIASRIDGQDLEVQGKPPAWLKPLLPKRQGLRQSFTA